MGIQMESSVLRMFQNKYIFQSAWERTQNIELNFVLVYNKYVDIENLFIYSKIYIPKDFVHTFVYSIRNQLQNNDEFFAINNI